MEQAETLATVLPPLAAEQGTEANWESMGVTLWQEP